MNDINNPDSLIFNIINSLQENKLKFLATDRNVMNLPRIGKSMTFKLIGIDSQGRRILSFSHDHSREHSPMIEHSPEIFIRERKSISTYLRQLKELGEEINVYGSIWSYRDSEKESRSMIDEYPDFEFEINNKYTNLD